MKATWILLFSISLFSCNQNRRNSKKLCDSAFHLVIYNKLRNPLRTKQDSDKRNIVYGKAMGLLNRAIKIDDKYLGPYFYKVLIFKYIQQYDSALVAAKHMYKSSPKSPLSNIYVGELCEKTGDTVSSRTYFNNALISYNKLLAANDKDAEIFQYYKYTNVETDRALVLIMLNQQEKGSALLNELYAKEKDTRQRAYTHIFLKKTKKEILDGDMWY